MIITFEEIEKLVTPKAGGGDVQPKTKKNLTEKVMLYRHDESFNMSIG